MRKIYFKNISGGKQNLPAYQFHLLQKFSDQIEHAVLTRYGGTSAIPFDSLNLRFGIGDNQENVIKNRKIVCEAFKIEMENIVSVNQTHSKNVAVVDEEFLLVSRQIEPTNYDALITNISGNALMIQVADCQAVLIYDQVKKVIGAVHAGWKGLAKDVTGNTIKMMKKNFGSDPKNLLIGIAPSLGPCCAFFSNPEKELPENFHKFIDPQKRVNLWDFSLEQLQKHGVDKANIELAKVCTQCGQGCGKGGKNNFFSFRGQRGITGRFGVLIMLRQ